MTLDDKVFTAPVVSARIDGGITQITGGSFSGENGIQEAKSIASILNAKKSTYRFKIIVSQNLNPDDK